ncbi:MAG: alpha/beta fold hydrolase [Gammaproteobacteria bacterium]|nr:alpha/beta fold hydrolase [Gammaproteobacteria bacterium]
MNARDWVAELQTWQQRYAQMAERVRAHPEAASGVTPRKELAHEPGWRLYRYGDVAGPPLLIVFALVNRPDVLDLTPERSLIGALLEHGVNVHLIEWDEPPRRRDISLATYLQTYLARCVQHVLDANGTTRLDLLGVCQGGVFSLCYTALQPAQVRRLITMVTPVDFHTPDNALSNLLANIDVTLMADVLGNIPGSLITRAFLALKPYTLVSKKYLDAALGEISEERLEAFLRMERWIHDTPDLAGTAFREFVQLFFHQNRLVEGALRLGASDVDIRSIRQPVFNVYATRDHIVPPAAARALSDLLPHAPYAEFAVDSGHIGIYVSRTASAQVPRRIANWLAG